MTASAFAKLPAESPAINAKDAALKIIGDSNLMKIRVQHQEYRSVFWSYREQDRVWAQARYDEGLNRIIPQGAFRISEMVYLT